MPYAIRQNEDGSFKVVNTETGEVHAGSTTKGNAKAQVRLLQGVKHGMKPRGAAKGAVIDPYLPGPRRATGPAPVGKPQVIRTTREVITGKRGNR